MARETHAHLVIVMMMVTLVRQVRASQCRLYTRLPWLLVGMLLQGAWAGLLHLPRCRGAVGCLQLLDRRCSSCVYTRDDQRHHSACLKP